MINSISILGSSGSIGTQALEVAKELNIKVSALAVKSNISLLESQIRRFNPQAVCVFDEGKANLLRKNISDMNVKVYDKMDGLCELASNNNSEMVLNAISGMIGLKPTLSVINAKKNIALANKETLVTAGELVMRAVKENNVKLLPVDSEHSAIFQCLQGNTDSKQLKKIILTASGGPFFNKSWQDLQNVTLEQALNHPTWNMGLKNTIDSATLVNKCLEIIEAMWLFDVSYDMIDVLIHRESVVHSMIEYIDNSILAQLSTPNMKIPIQYAFSYPQRVESSVSPLDFDFYSKLTFFKPDYQTFESLNICKYVISQGGILPTVFNCANEEAVNLFLNKKIKFLDIIQIIKMCINKVQNIQAYTLDDILYYDEFVRNFIHNEINI